MDCSLRGSSVQGIFQARVLEWVTIAFFVSIMKSKKYLFIIVMCLGPATHFYEYDVIEFS